MFIDSHCHLQLIDFKALGLALPDILENAVKANVKRLLCVATHLDQLDSLYTLAEQYEGIDISIGLHPNEIIQFEPTVDDLVKAASHPKVVAIGETGLDYYRTETQSIQHERFSRHVAAAMQLKKPVIIHSRDAAAGTLTFLKQTPGLTGVFHCFTYDYTIAKQVVDLGFYLSFSGILTFKNAHELKRVAKEIPLSTVLIETDCPYLAPAPYRGKVNQPAYIKEVAQYLADLKGVSLEMVAEITTENYKRLFNPVLASPLSVSHDQK